MRQALGTAVFFGMLGVTFFGLVFTPVFYVTCRWFGGLLQGASEGHRQRGAADPGTGSGSE
jgi:HAE1 family hydrophobic/amphiphilic exporter-1